MTAPQILERPLHKTIVPADELQEGTVDCIRGWRRPRHAYVLFETKIIHLKSEGVMIPGHGIFTLNLEARPEQQGKIQQYLDKGFRIIDFGNFPKATDPDPRRAKMARMYSGPNGENPWVDMENFLNNKMRTQNPNWQSEKEALMRQIEDLQKGVKPKETIADKARNARAQLGEAQ